MVESFLCNLHVEITDGNNPPEGTVGEYHGGNHDLNHGWRGRYAWLVAQFHEGEESAMWYIVHPEVSLGPEPTEGEGPDYAAGTGGWYRYIRGRVTEDLAPVRRIKLFRTPMPYDAYAITKATGYKHSSIDLNTDRGRGVDDEGTFLYLIWD